MNTKPTGLEPGTIATNSSESPHSGADVDMVLKKLGSIIDFHEKYNDCSGTWDPQNNELIEHADRCQKCELRDLYEDIDGLRLRPLTANSESPTCRLPTDDLEYLKTIQKSISDVASYFEAEKPTSREVHAMNTLVQLARSIRRTIEQKSLLTLTANCETTDAWENPDDANQRIKELEKAVEIAEKNAFQAEMKADAYCEGIALLEAKLKDCVVTLGKYATNTQVTRITQHGNLGREIRTDVGSEARETLARGEGKNEIEK